VDFGFVEADAPISTAKPQKGAAMCAVGAYYYFASSVWMGSYFLATPSKLVTSTNPSRFFLVFSESF
jgi:hypothetical protein